MITVSVLKGLIALRMKRNIDKKLSKKLLPQEPDKTGFKFSSETVK